MRIRHPRWCTERAVCAEYDTHTSRRYSVNPEGDEPARLTVWMEQLHHAPGDVPIVIVEAVVDGVTTPYVLPTAQAGTLARVVRQLLDESRRPA